VRRALAAATVGALVVLTSASSVQAQLLGCTISASPVSFGTYDVFDASARDGTGSIEYSCLLSLSLSVRISLDAGSGGSFASRRMVAGTGDTAAYNLYLDAARSTVWGDGTAGTSTARLSVLALVLAAGAMPVYGRMPPKQDLRVGSYSDGIVATISF
jgi:spore coat protein U-like protein